MWAKDNLWSNSIYESFDRGVFTKQRGNFSRSATETKTSLFVSLPRLDQSILASHSFMDTSIREQAYVFQTMRSQTAQLLEPMLHSS